MAQDRLTSAFVLLGLAAPLMTWYAYRTPQTVFDTGFYQTPLWWAMTAGLLLVVAFVVIPRELILGVALLYLVASSAWSAPFALSVATWLVLGGVFLIAASRCPSRLLRVALVGLGLLEIALLGLQYAGLYFQVGEWRHNTAIPHGTFGNPRYLGAALAVITPLAPLALLPVFGLGLVLSKSYAAILAASAGLVIRYHRKMRWPYVVAGGVSALGVLALLRGWSWDSLISRSIAWRVALAGWLDSWRSIIVGHGLGSWFPLGASFSVEDQVFYTAHSEYVQLLYEAGLAGAGLLAWFLWRRRRWLAVSPGVAAILVVCLGLNPFRFASTAVVLLAVAGYELGRGMDVPCAA